MMRPPSGTVRSGPASTVGDAFTLMTCRAKGVSPPIRLARRPTSWGPGVVKPQFTLAPFLSKYCPSPLRSQLKLLKPSGSGWNEVEVKTVAAPVLLGPTVNEARGYRAAIQAFSAGAPTRV